MTDPKNDPETAAKFIAEDELPDALDEHSKAALEQADEATREAGGKVPGFRTTQADVDALTGPKAVQPDPHEQADAETADAEGKVPGFEATTADVADLARTSEEADGE